MDINGHWQLFDYLDPRGQNVMQAWSMDLSVKERARLDLKIDVLERSGDKLSYKLITQTSGRYRQRQYLGNSDERPSGPAAYALSWSF